MLARHSAGAWDGWRTMTDAEAARAVATGNRLSRMLGEAEAMARRERTDG